MAFAELRMRRARIMSIAHEIDNFPTERLVERLREEAKAGIDCDPKCAMGFVTVAEIGANLLRVGAGATTGQLSKAVIALDVIVDVRLMQPTGLASCRRDGLLPIGADRFVRRQNASRVTGSTGAYSNRERLRGGQVTFIGLRKWYVRASRCRPPARRSRYRYRQAVLARPSKNGLW